MKKRSFFERLTGSVNIDDEEMETEEMEEIEEPKKRGLFGGSKSDKTGKSNSAIYNSLGNSVGGKTAHGARGQSASHGHLPHVGNAGNMGSNWMDEQAGDGELSLDVFQTPDEVVVKAMIPGVRKEDLDISLTRDSVTIRGSRKEEKVVSDDDYYHRELYWGSFSRTVQLPHEVDIEHAEASESQGILTVKLPRVDKDRQMKLRVKSN